MGVPLFEAWLIFSDSDVAGGGVDRATSRVRLQEYKSIIY